MEQVTYDRWDPVYELDMRGKKPPILVWKYEDAPEEIKARIIAENFWFTPDWVALRPPQIKSGDIPCMLEEGSFLFISSGIVDLEDGGAILVGNK
jgi:hypothetical protein